jgi:hypothetical protein
VAVAAPAVAGLGRGRIQAVSSGAHVIEH